FFISLLCTEEFQHVWVTKCYFSVRNMASTLTEEQFQCSICLYSFKNPVSIPCGHNFCLECIKRYWDVAHKSECPLCKESFRSRPELRVNWLIRCTSSSQSLLKEMPGFKPVPPKRPIIPLQSRWEKEVVKYKDAHGLFCKELQIFQDVKHMFSTSTSADSDKEDPRAVSTDDPDPNQKDRGDQTVNGAEQSEHCFLIIYRHEHFLACLLSKKQNFN
uniref:RING-type domain-containing protein n=1 Tax=Oreochromis aureus TaxID=47969 RepID=A0AAZ1XBB4_OREAU